ncbi:hypothetical protein Tco_0252043 [Tanacetum coccineum]
MKNSPGIGNFAKSANHGVLSTRRAPIQDFLRGNVSGLPLFLKFILDEGSQSGKKIGDQIAAPFFVSDDNIDSWSKMNTTCIILA